MDRSAIRKLISAVTGEATCLDADTLEDWVRDFYECSGCRRCAKFCPFSIDNSVITRKGRGVLNSVGLTPAGLAATQQASDKFGNDEAISYPAFMDAVGFLQEELLEEHGVPVKIPVDQQADVLFVSASMEILLYPETLMGCAAFFHAAGIKWTMSSEAFDAANFGLYTGDDEHMRRKNRLLHDACIKLKAKKLVIGECGHAYRVARYIGGPKYWGKDIPYEITNIFALAVEAIRTGIMRRSCHFESFRTLWSREVPQLTPEWSP
jgi:Fe-S oxidoreductase